MTVLSLQFGNIETELIDRDEKKAQNWQDG